MVMPGIYFACSNELCSIPQASWLCKLSIMYRSKAKKAQINKKIAAIQTRRILRVFKASKGCKDNFHLVNKDSKTDTRKLILYKYCRAFSFFLVAFHANKIKRLSHLA